MGERSRERTEELVKILSQFESKKVGRKVVNWFVEIHAEFEM